jgi:hypothetical protein
MFLRDLESHFSCEKKYPSKPTLISGEMLEWT